MMKKQLIVVVEGTGAMGPLWKTIISDYLEKMIRSFTEVDSIEQNPSAGDVELSLVVFNGHDSYSACMLQRSGWTRDVDLFFQWLSALPFSGGGFNDVAAAEGLAEALMMFASLNGSQQTQQNADGQRHCILVAASNPYALPRRVYYPAMLNLEQSGNVEAHTSLQLADAEIVARAFPQCSVSLSVICPRKLPKLRAIYNAGKRDRQAAAPPVDTSKNPNFLVLISENFSEACAAFSHTEMESLAPNQTLVEMDMSSLPPVSGPAATSNPPVMNQQPISAGNILAATVNIEPTMVTSVSGPAPPHILTAHHTSQVAASPRGIGMHQYVPSGMGTGIPLEIGTMRPTPGMTQQGQPEILPLGRNNSAEANMSLSQQQTLATLPSAQSGYVKIWEGNLSMVRWGSSAHITRLQGYKRSSASASPAANLPQTLQIHHFIAKDHMFEHVRQCTGKADILAFWAIDRHEVLNYLLERNFSGVISLPSQTLFIYVSDKTSCLIGLRLPNENMEFRPTIPSQQLQAQPLPRVQQLQAQALPGVQQLQAQALPGVQQLQAQPLPGVQQLQAQPLLGLQQLQAQPLPGLQQLQAQPLPGVQQLQAQPLPGVQQLQAQPLPGMQQVQAQPLPRLQQLQAQPLPRLQQLQAQPLPRLQQLQAQPLSGVQQLQAQPLPGVQQLQAQPLPGVQQLQAQPLPRVQQLQAQPLPGMQQLQAQSIAEADSENQDWLEFLNFDD